MNWPAMVMMVGRTAELKVNKKDCWDSGNPDRQQNTFGGIED